MDLIGVALLQGGGTERKEEEAHKTEIKVGMHPKKNETSALVVDNSGQVRKKIKRWGLSCS